METTGARRFRRLFFSVGFIALFLLLDYLTHSFRTDEGAVPWYPPAGLGIALLWGMGVRYAPLYLVAVAIGNYWVWGFASQFGLPFYVFCSVVVPAPYIVTAYLGT